jgi:sugar phosphate isomerase/epimerase
MKFSLARLAGLALGASVLLLSSGCSTPGSSVGTGRHFKGPVGLQLYSLRGQFTQNVPAAIQTTKGFGIHEVELAGLYNLKPVVLREMLTGAGLRPISGHFPYSRFKNDPESIALEAKALGLKYAGCAWIDHAGPSITPDEARAAAEVFNQAGAAFAKHGIKCFYHCHGFEFVPDASGTTPMDILMRQTHPGQVCFEMDVVWVIYPGQDPAAWLKKYPGRWELMHLKDLRKGVMTGNQTGKGDPNDDVVLGTGQVNWPSVLAAAQRYGVKHYFIEDESASVVTQVPQTLRYLETVSW